MCRPLTCPRLCVPLMHFQVALFPVSCEERQWKNVNQCSFPRFHGRDGQSSWWKFCPVDALTGYGHFCNLINFIIVADWKRRAELVDMRYDGLFCYNLEKSTNFLLLDAVREDMLDTNLAFVIIFGAFQNQDQLWRNNNKMKRPLW